LFELPLMKLFHIRDSFSQCNDNSSINTLRKTLELVRAYAQLRNFQIDFIKTPAVIDQRAIATRPYVVNYRRHQRHQLSVERDRPPREMVQKLFDCLWLFLTNDPHCVSLYLDRICKISTEFTRFLRDLQVFILPILKHPVIMSKTALPQKYFGY
jgi:hypothetical protein